MSFSCGPKIGSKMRGDSHLCVKFYPSTNSDKLSVPGLLPVPSRTPPLPGTGAPRRKHAEKTPPKAAHVHTRHQSRCMDSGPVSRVGTPTLQGTAQHHPQLLGPRRIEAESITIVWPPEGSPDELGGLAARHDAHVWIPPPLA